MVLEEEIGLRVATGTLLHVPYENAGKTGHRAPSWQATSGRVSDWDVSADGSQVTVAAEDGRVRNTVACDKGILPKFYLDTSLSPSFSYFNRLSSGQAHNLRSV
jgi:hypothetical protein